ncbi:MAG: hypothetical protein IJR83_07795 [Clostridia bacterium]|nr:hypothetical protein [Clostridia bacterium]
MDPENTIEAISVISGFTRCTAEQFNLLREKLLLRMTVEELQYCASCYRAEGRDPGTEELRVLDRLLSLQYRYPGDFVIRSLKSSSQQIGRTWDDLIRRRKALRIPPGKPVALCEIPYIISKDLQKLSQDPVQESLPRLVPQGRDEKPYLDTGVIGASLFRSSNGVMCLTGDKDYRPAGHVLPGDSIFLLNGSFRSFMGLADRQSDLAYLHDLFTIATDGLFLSSVYRLPGAEFRFGDLSGIFGSSDIPELVSRGDGSMLAVTDKESREAFLALAAELSIDTTEIGAVSASGVFSVEKDGVRPVTLSGRLLKSLRLSLPFAASPEPGTAERDPFTLPSPVFVCGKEPDTDNALRLVSCDDPSDPFADGLKLVLLALMEAACEGGLAESSSFSLCTNLPPVQNESGATLQTGFMLGVYRGLCECAVRLSECRYTQYETSPLSCDLFILSRKQTEKTGPVSGSGVYLAEFPSSADGLPDISSVRSFCRKLASGLGKIPGASARVICGRNPGQLLEELKLSAVPLPGCEGLFEEKVDLGFLVFVPDTVNPAGQLSKIGEILLA